jgi:hypothetical protein
MTVVYFLLVACMPILVEAQTWQPAARLWGMKMQPYVLHTQGHPPLIPLSKALEFPARDTFLFYAIPTLQTGAEVYGTLHGLRRIYRPVFDFSGNDLPDVIGSDTAGGGALLMDAYSTFERMRPPKLDGGFSPGDWSEPWAVVDDLDGDGVNDVLAPHDPPIVYGDRSEPFTQGSTYSAIPTSSETRFVTYGVLEGVAYILSFWITERSPNRFDYKYVLEELDSEDLRSRRDTVARRIVDTLQVPSGDYGDVIITFDSLWHLPAYWQSESPNTSLLVTRQGLEVAEVDPSFRSYDGYSLVGDQNFGQWKFASQHVVRIDGYRPFLHHDNDDVNAASRLRWMELYRITDASVLRTELLGRMDLADGSTEVGGLRNACLVPDIDGDMIEDAMVYYVAADSATGKGQEVVDLFLTTQRVITSVHSLSDPTDGVGSARPPDVYRLSPTLWHVTVYGTVLPVPPEAELIDVRGSVVGRARLSVQSISPTATVIAIEATGVVSPVWVQLGGMSIRLQ